MGYKTTALIAVDDSYGDIDWGEFKDDIDETIKDEGVRTVYRFDWAKRTYKIVEYFLENIAKKDENDYFETDTFGVIEMGEEMSDIEYYGDYWDFEIEVDRSLSIY